MRITKAELHDGWLLCTAEWDVKGTYGTKDGWEVRHAVEGVVLKVHFTISLDNGGQLKVKFLSGESPEVSPHEHASLLGTANTSSGQHRDPVVNVPATSITSKDATVQPPNERELQRFGLVTRPTT